MVFFLIRPPPRHGHFAYRVPFSIRLDMNVQVGICSGEVAPKHLKALAAKKLGGVAPEMNIN